MDSFPLGRLGTQANHRTRPTDEEVAGWRAHVLSQTRQLEKRTHRGGVSRETCDGETIRQSMLLEKRGRRGPERRTGVAPVLFFKTETGATPVLLVCLFVVTAQTISTAHATNSFPVSIRVDASKPIGPLRPFW